MTFSSSAASTVENCGGMRRHPEGDPHASGCEGPKPYMYRAGLGRRDPGNGAEVEAMVQKEVVGGLDLPTGPSSISAGAPEGDGIGSETPATRIPFELPMFSDGTNATCRYKPQSPGASKARKSKEFVEWKGKQGRPAEETADPAMKEGLTRAGQEFPPREAGRLQTFEEMACKETSQLEPSRREGKRGRASRLGSCSQGNL